MAQLRRCDGGILSAGRAPNATQCRPGLTTVAPRSSGPASCVNQPGFAYQVDPSGLPTAAPCPVNTYNQVSVTHLGLLLCACHPTICTPQRIRECWGGNKRQCVHASATLCCFHNSLPQGLRRQRTCLPCPTGWTTNGLTGQTDVSACGKGSVCSLTAAGKVLLYRPMSFLGPCLTAACVCCVCCRCSGPGGVVPALPHNRRTLSSRAVEELGGSR